MRLHFPNGEREDFGWADGVLTVGSDPSCGLVLDKTGVAAKHLTLTVSRVRGIELQIHPGAEVHVNGRAVREKALLRLGDMLLLHDLKIILRSDSDRREVPPPDSAELHRKLAPRASLRAVSGQHFGKMIALKARNTIGRGTECDIVLNDPGMSRQHAAIENTGHGMFLRDLGSSNGTYVNGIQVRDAILRHGDQIAFDSHRFLLEILGLSPLDLAMNRPSPTKVIRPVTPPSTPTLSGGPITPPHGVPTSPAAPPPPPPITDLEHESRATFWANAMLILAGVSALAILVYIFAFKRA